jgi:DNA-directed RNA polymerase specialized sigma24 family protein
MSAFLDSHADVVRGLVTYTDWWQPATSSVMAVGAARRSSNLTDGIGTGLLDRLDERAELRRRMLSLGEPDRRLLYLWYVAQLPAGRIAQMLSISRRQCFRRRAAAIRRIVEFQPGSAA